MLCGSRIFDEIAHLPRGGRESGEIECGAPQQSDAIAWRSGLQALPTQLLENESVNGILACGDRHMFQRLEFPGIFGAVIPRRLGLGVTFGPGRSKFDPAANRRDIGIGQFASRRHFEGAGLLDRGNEQALGGVVRNDRRTAFASAQHPISRIEAEIAYLLTLAMTTFALLFQDGADMVQEDGATLVRLAGENAGNKG